MSKLQNFKPAKVNPNKHTQRGLKALDASMREDGYTEPMVVAADGETLSGAARLEVAADVFGLDAEPLIIESDGTRPIIHRRTDIATADTPAGRRVSLRSNRIAELDLDWDPEVLVGYDAEFLEALWTPEELSALGDAWIREAADPNALWQGMPEFEQEAASDFPLVVHFETAEDRVAFAHLLGQTITEKTKYIWYPYKPPMNLKPYQAVDES